MQPFGDLGAETLLGGRVLLRRGDCLRSLKALPDNSVDAIVCDPPYHLNSIVKRFGGEKATASRSGPHQRTARGFMGKKWDGGMVAFRWQTWAKAWRVLKPGGFIVAFSSCRTFGRMSVAIEDAGFIVHPMLGWVFHQGFPKAHRVDFSGLSDLDRLTGGWEGWRYGTQAMKPAFEPIFVGQKPFSEKNGALNVQRWGVGALNIDACRIATAEDLSGGAYAAAGGRSPWSEIDHGLYRPGAVSSLEFEQPAGRWPANLIHDGSAEVMDLFPMSDGQSGAITGREPTANGFSGEVYGFGGTARRPLSEPRDDEGSSARFYFAAKADDDDRLGSKHPTVKPISLMRWLVKLVTPPGGTVLDMFAGTGTTGEAAFYEGASAILLERDPTYCGDIRRRMELALAGPEERQRATIKAKGKLNGDPGPLFSER